MDIEQALDKYGKIFDAGTVLFYEGDVGTKIWIINEGTVQLTKRVCSEEILVETLGPGSFCGELALVGGGVQPVTATIVEPARMLCVDTTTFEAMLRDNGELCIRMIKKLAGRLSETQFRLTAMQLRSSMGRVMLQLRHELEDSQTEGTAIVPDDIPEILAMDAVDVLNTIDRLVAKNLITYEEETRAFTIVDPEEYVRYLNYLELRDRYEFFDKH